MKIGILTYYGVHNHWALLQANALKSLFKLSILLTGDHLDMALKSVENQTVVPNEIVLVEDGPISDDLRKVIANHQKQFKSTFKVIISKKNRGLGASLRLGMKYISTDWIARMDTDDFSKPTRFEKQLRIVSDDPELAVISGQISEFSVDITNIVGKRIVPAEKRMIVDFLKWRSPFNHQTVLLNKKKILSVGGYIPFGNLEDYYALG